MPYATENRRAITAILLVFMFLFADLIQHDSWSSVDELETESPNLVVAQYQPDLTTYITSNNTSENFYNSETLLIGANRSSEAKSLISFPNNLLQNQSIISASLRLTCSSVSYLGTLNTIRMYASSLDKIVDYREATWVNADATQTWDVAGINSTVDRSGWEIPASSTPNGYNLNVTYLVQQDHLGGEGTFEFVISAVGGMTSCASETNPVSASYPEIVIEYSNSSHGTGGSVSSDFINDGEPIMMDDFILSADLNPTFSYSALVGDEVEFQFSVSDDFRTYEHPSRVYSTMNDPFIRTLDSGEYTIPSADRFSAGSKIFYRYRSIDNTSMLSDWNVGNFLLPNYTVVDNNDGTATITLQRDSLGILGYNLIEDVSTKSNTGTFRGKSTELALEYGSNIDTLIFTRLNLNHLGLHSNATISEAKLSLNSIASNPNLMVSMHLYEGPEWVEEETNYQYYSQSNQWSDGGRNFLGPSVKTGLYIDTLKRYNFDFDIALQNQLDSGLSTSLDFAMIGFTTDDLNIPPGGLIQFNSSESITNQPEIEITYTWTQNDSVIQPSLESPINGEPVWNLTGHNLSGNQTPSLKWNETNNPDHGIIYQLSNDSLFRSIIVENDARTQQNINSSMGEIQVSSNSPLEKGKKYYWRVAHFDGDLRVSNWSYGDFLVSSLTSSYTGQGDRHMLEIQLGTESNSNELPNCKDITLSSSFPSSSNYGAPYMAISSSISQGESVSLLQCDLSNYVLPDGYAVEYSIVELNVISSSQSPEIAVFEGNNHDWVESQATWNQYSLGKYWSSGGANGNDRGSILDSQVVSSGVVGFNITSATQNADRNAEPLDLIFGIISNSNMAQDAYFSSHYDSDPNKHPKITIYYMPGSKEQPSQAQPVIPANGSFIYEDDFHIVPNQTPTLNWTTNSNIHISGWAIEFDTTEDFDSPENQQFTSWNSGLLNSQGFDITNESYTFNQDLDMGKTYYWRVRALSATNQLGDWSSTFHFILPNLTINSISNDLINLEISHNSVHEELGLPEFTDTHLFDMVYPLYQNNHSSEQSLQVGSTILGANSSSLIRISLDSEIQPLNSRLVEASLNLYSLSNSFVGNDIAVRTVLVPWLNNATTNTSDGYANWSEIGGRGIGTDIGPICDIQTTTQGWMSWNITHIAQEAMRLGHQSISIMLYNYNLNPGEMAYFSSSESATNQPKLSLTWANGSVVVPSEYPENLNPLQGEILWDDDSHALIPEMRPSLQWDYVAQGAIPDAWRVIVGRSMTDELQGEEIFDSRINPQYFNLASLTFNAPIDFDFDTRIRWQVQPIFQDVLGPVSNETYYWVPSAVGMELTGSDASLELQEGSIISQLNYSQVTIDTTLDEGFPTDSMDGNGLLVGESSVANSPQYSASSLLAFDWSNLPLPTDYEIISANLSLTSISGSGVVDVSVSRMISQWDENSTWDNPANGTSWLSSGALRGADSDIPDSYVSVDSLGVHTWDVTRIVQMSVNSGSNNASIILQPEVAFNMNNSIEGNYTFADSESSQLSSRPKLTLQYRTKESWLPSAPSLQQPTDGSTLWNLTSPIPNMPDHINFEVSSAVSNATSWNICLGDDSRWLNCTSSTQNSLDFQWDASNYLFNYTNSTQISQDSGDEWHYWRMRADQDHRIGHYSPIYKYRIPGSHGNSDGNGNYTIELTRGSIFESTGRLPEVVDAGIDSQDMTNTGSSTELKVGYNPISTGYSSSLFEFDLTHIPFPSATTPTSMMLQLELSPQTPILNPMTISAFACSSFIESQVNYANAPSCSNSELTRTTVSGTSGSLVEWDISALGQTNFASANRTFSIKLSSTGLTQDSYDFLSSESSGFEPRLVLNYVDNVNGIVPPGQPVLALPADGDIIYDSTSQYLQAGQMVPISWNQVANSTWYKLFVQNSTSLVTYDSRTSSEITGSVFTPSVPFVAGETYTWWVQAGNESIPGPSSPRWTFAIADPQHYSNNDGTITYEFQDSVEVPDFSHVNIRDTSINDVFGDSNYGIEETMTLGTGCYGTQFSQCYAMISLDSSQVPLDNTQNIHSAELSLFVDSWDLSGGAYEIEFTVHEFLYTNWNEVSLTWNNTGANPGPIAGVDYISTPIDTKRYSSSDTVLNFEIAMPGMAIDDERHWIIIANPISFGGPFDGLVNVYSSDEVTMEDKRPLIKLKHTNVSSLNLTTQSTTFDADNAIVFDLSTTDVTGSLMSTPVPTGASIDWYSTTGTINSISASSASFTPTSSGLNTITACYGIICSDYILTIGSGMPVQLFASLDDSSTVQSATITADEDIEIFAYAIDQHGNLVTGEVIDFTTTNGSIDSNNFFYPYLIGEQTITVQWIGTSTTLSIDLTVIVEPGAPDLVEISGCDLVVQADTKCLIYATVFDQFGNYVWFDVFGSYSLSVTNGEVAKVLTSTPHTSPPLANILVGEFTGDQVGEWDLTLTTDSGFVDSIKVNVTHGAMSSFELETSSTSITTDDSIYLYATRIDVRGNRLDVTIPEDNWTNIADGQILPGETSVWIPKSLGTKTINATYQGYYDTVSVFVSKGLIADFQILVNGERSNDYLFNITTDDSITTSVKAVDSKGNDWSIDNGYWTISHSIYGDDNNLLTVLGSQSIFNPVKVSNEAYYITVSYVEDGINHTSSISVLVSVGDLGDFEVTATDWQGSIYQDLGLFEITSDGYVEFAVGYYDSELNTISDWNTSWILTNKSDGSQFDITSEMLQNSLVWSASEVGEWEISASTVNDMGIPFSRTFDLNISHGVPKSIEVYTSADTQDAGKTITLTVLGTDEDGNIFSQPVTWTENGGTDFNINSTSNSGVYEFKCRVAGQYDLVAEYLSLNNNATVEVFAQNTANNIKFNVSAESLEQLETLTIKVQAFDEYGNEINMPLGARIDTTGRADVNYLGNGVWELETLDEGEQSATIVVGSITETFTYTVEGNLAGFFAAGGPLYYAGAGLIALVVIALLVFAVRFLRGDGDYYDDDEDDDFSYDFDGITNKSSPSKETRSAPTPPAQPPSRPEPVVVESPEPEHVEEYSEEEDTSWMADYRVEDDGTEWGETDDGVWYYREVNSDEWIEWTE